ncbi:MAG: GIY-YIG nuclease family protein [Firmicutes bacterium]|nr:GIY-YIG nuclease family protein [Bacillota bacterium]
MAYLYIVECEGNTLYTGITTNIENRMKDHKERRPKCAKYTRSHPVKRLVALWKVDTYDHARKAEYAVKQLDRKKKDRLVANPEKLKELCPKLSELEFVPITDRLDILREI